MGRELSIGDEDLGVLLILVKHLDRLTPELPKGSNKTAWQESEEFKHDFVYACEAIDTIVGIRIKDLTEPLEHAEDFFFNECERLQKKLRESIDEEDHEFVEMVYDCLCKNHTYT